MHHGVGTVKDLLHNMKKLQKLSKELPKSQPSTLIVKKSMSPFKDSLPSNYLSMGKCQTITDKELPKESLILCSASTEK